MPTNVVPSFMAGKGSTGQLPQSNMPTSPPLNTDPFAGNSAGGMAEPPMPMEGADPMMQMMQSPPEQEANKEPDFDGAMVELVNAGSNALDQNDLKVLRKITPDLAWVLGKIFGVPAVTALQKIYVEKAQGFAGANSGQSRPQSML